MEGHLAMQGDADNPTRGSFPVVGDVGSDFRVKVRRDC